jgi:hypothetical protein
MIYASRCCGRAPFRPEKLAPAAKLGKVAIPLRPSEAVLAPLGVERDMLPNGRMIHALLLTYKLAVAEAGKHTVTLPLLNRCHCALCFSPLSTCCLISYKLPATVRSMSMQEAVCAVGAIHLIGEEGWVKIKPNLRTHGSTLVGLCRRCTFCRRFVACRRLFAVQAPESLRRCCLRARFVYDGELEGQMSMLCDGNKRLLKVSDIYPEDVQLGKGDYVIRVQLRHDDTGARPMPNQASCCSATTMPRQDLQH